MEVATINTLTAKSNPDRRVYYRLVALWVLAEAMLGGMIHGLRLPVSGLIVGSAAVVCISLIAWYDPRRGAILQATIIVAAFKLTLSPHSGVFAFTALFFQGVCGELLFGGRRNFAFNTTMLAVLALLESGFQRIIVLTLVYGRELWSVINDLGTEWLPGPGKVNYSLYIVLGYLLIHFITALWIGSFAGRLPSRIDQVKPVPVLPDNREPAPFVTVRKRARRLLILVWVLLLLLLIQASIFPGEAWLPENRTAKILVRSLIIMIGWAVLLGPALKYLLRRWLAGKKSALSREIAAVSSILPDMRMILQSAWRSSSGCRGLKRVSLFTRLTMARATRNARVIIWTGPIHSGKTTRLSEWLKGCDAGGILTPKIGGKRWFRDISGGRTFQMDASADSENVIWVGGHCFDAAAFSEASGIIRRAINRHEWLVIDEIGPLELKGEGFAEILQEVMLRQQANLVLVIREGMLIPITEKFSIISDEIVRPDPELFVSSEHVDRAPGP